ncbi:MAG: GDP-mannose-dependent alpha-(1-6)-phosphatidylinositol monomannoside mannosyltransferase [Candidatus Anoxychlamydiales bacterium]|nr:GDP-mannose-dependent alpha-(1-6)-phosphatidylinositol monomannoside mannosyltransferase [Candidatus Anoxychlamydiales bacterium]
MKTAIVHDWLVSVAGGEKVLKLMHDLYPSKIYTLLKNPKFLKNSFFEDKKIETSFIQKLPFSKNLYQKYLMFFPFAIEQFDLSEYDVILSSSHCVAKGVLTRFDQLHICYCHTPMRYAWDLYFQYLHESNLKKGIKAKIAQMILHYLRMWDVTSASRVDEFIANSKFIAQRIKKLYNKEAKVIYPPVDVNFFEPCYKKDGYYFTASRLVPYKKIDLIVEAFSKMPDKKLVVIGDGPDMKKIKAKAFRFKNIEVLGYQKDEVLKKYMKEAKAFVFAAIEDFGILPIEAMASATPVIALSRGGTKETVIDNKTGILFNEQNIESVIDAVKRFEKTEFDLNFIRKHAEKFSNERFKEEFDEYVKGKIKEHNF